MKIMCSGCGDCTLKRTAKGMVRCRVTDAVLMGGEPGSVDYVSANGIHPECKMLSERLVFQLDAKTKRGSGGYLEAFIGNRIRLADGRKGVVVGKHRNAMDAGISVGLVDESVRDRPWYKVLYDGEGSVLAAGRNVCEILKEHAEYNFNMEFEFYFGFDDEE